MVEINQEGEYQIVPFPPERKAIDIGDYYSNFEKIKKDLGWQPHVSLKDGLARTLKYYKKYYQYY